MNYQKKYSEKSFWNKVIKVAKKAGKEAIITALTLYYCMMDPDTPVWAKTTIAGALGYFILPFDMIPDALIPVGYTDDIGVFATAMLTVSSYIKEEHKEKAQKKVDELFS